MKLKYYLLHLELHKAGGIPINIKNGVIRKPPPTPKSPERTPTKNLKKVIKKCLH